MWIHQHERISHPAGLYTPKISRVNVLHFMWIGSKGGPGSHLRKRIQSSEIKIHNISTPHGIWKNSNCRAHWWSGSIWGSCSITLCAYLPVFMRNVCERDSFEQSWWKLVSFGPKNYHVYKKGSRIFFIFHTLTNENVQPSLGCVLFTDKNEKSLHIDLKFSRNLPTRPPLSPLK